MLANTQMMYPRPSCDGLEGRRRLVAAYPSSALLSGAYRHAEKHNVAGPRISLLVTIADGEQMRLEPSPLSSEIQPAEAVPDRLVAVIVRREAITDLLRGRAHEIALAVAGDMRIGGPMDAVADLLGLMPALGRSLRDESGSHPEELGGDGDRFRTLADSSEVRCFTMAAVLPSDLSISEPSHQGRLAALVLVGLPDACQAAEISALARLAPTAHAESAMRGLLAGLEASIALSGDRSPGLARACLDPTAVLARRSDQVRRELIAFASYSRRSAEGARQQRTEEENPCPQP